MKYFKPEEFACRCGCGGNSMDPAFLDKLDRLREHCGFPLRVASGYRCHAHNRGLRGGPAHPSGHAADLEVDRTKAYVVLFYAFAFGFTGIGVQQKGDARFIHLDDLPDSPGAPRPTVWSY